ncbi:MAG: contact-dependent growth inhibition system immunity protein [Bacteroidia bacterium]
MKLENNWRQKSIENLEQKINSSVNKDEDSHLIRTCYYLSKKPIQDFTTEDLRIMIGQEIGLFFLMPIAIEILTKNVFAEGDLYEGDLLKSILDINTVFWNNNKNYWLQLNEIIKNNYQEIEEMKFDTHKFYSNKHSL